MRNLVGLSIAVLLVQACSSKSNPNPSDDLGAPDMTTPVTGDDMAGLTNTGTLLLPATQFVATTSDDYAVAFTGAKGGVSAVALTGGTPTVIDANGTSVSIANKGVFSWAGVSSTTTVGALTVWTSGLTAPRQAAMKSLAGTAAATTDGTYIAYTDNATQGAAADIYVGKADGTGTATKIVTAADTTNTACPIILATTGTAFFVSYCTGDAHLDMGTTMPGLYYVDPAAATPTPTALSTDAVNFSADKAGDKAWYVDSTKQLYFTAVPAGGAATLVDTNVTGAYITTDGSALIWLTSAGALKRASTTALATVTTLVATGVNTLLDISPDETIGLVSDVAADATTGQVDIASVSLTAASTPKPLVTDKTGQIYGSSFTPDSKIALWYDANSGFVATLHQTTLATSASAVVSTKVWNHTTTIGTKILYMDNEKGATATVTGKADLHILDLAGGAATLIVQQAQALNSITLSHDKTKVLYDVQNNPTAAKNGVYIAPAQ